MGSRTAALFLMQGRCANRRWLMANGWWLAVHRQQLLVYSTAADGYGLCLTDSSWRSAAAGGDEQTVVAASDRFLSGVTESQLCRLCTLRAAAGRWLANSGFGSGGRCGICGLPWVCLRSSQRVRGQPWLTLMPYVNQASLTCHGDGLFLTSGRPRAGGCSGEHIAASVWRGFQAVGRDVLRLRRQRQHVCDVRVPHRNDLPDPRGRRYDAAVRWR